jgi:hypothetical protein
VTDEEHFMYLRQSFEDELNEVEEKLKPLLARRIELKELLFGKKERSASVGFKEDPNVDLLLDHIRTHPGSNRQSIREVLGIEEKVLTNLLTKMVRRKLIENHGAKTQPKWFLVEK